MRVYPLWTRLTHFSFAERCAWCGKGVWWWQQSPNGRVGMGGAIQRQHWWCDVDVVRPMVKSLLCDHTKSDADVLQEVRRIMRNKSIIVPLDDWRTEVGCGKVVP